MRQFLNINAVSIGGKARRFRLKRIETQIFRAEAIAAADPGQIRGYGQISMDRFGSINSGCT
jgi:hypothetical protein